MRKVIGVIFILFVIFCVIDSCKRSQRLNTYITTSIKSKDNGYTNTNSSLIKKSEQLTIKSKKIKVIKKQP